MWVFLADQFGKDPVFIFWIKKNAFQTRKTNFSKSAKNGYFPKGLVHGFCQ